jgi:hypothetical protein
VDFRALGIAPKFQEHLEEDDAGLRSNVCVSNGTEVFALQCDKQA